MANVYCAGPLFNPPEQQEMMAIATLLEEHGHHTFLAQRDGLEDLQLPHELRGQPLSDSARIAVHHRATFALDVYYLLAWADVVVANLNGRVPDEGTVVECAMAWMKPIPLVLYKHDQRAPFDGYDNLMLTQLVQSSRVNSIAELPAAVEGVMREQHGMVERHIQLGNRIRALRSSDGFPERICEEVTDFLRYSRGDGAAATNATVTR